MEMLWKSSKNIERTKKILIFLCEYGKILILVKLEKIKKDQGERKSMKKRKYLALLLAAGMIVQTALSTGGVVQVQAAEDTYVILHFSMI